MGMFLSILFFSYTGLEVHNSKVSSYVNNHKDLAIVEMHRSGIPASIKLGQAILESNCGTSSFAMQSNNHFGIKCKEQWKGFKYYHKDDDYDKDGELIKSCFRAYSQVSDSYTDHSNFLRESITYEPLFRLNKDDYKGWAKGLNVLGYASDKAYEEKLIRIIEKYQLHRYDIL